MASASRLEGSPSIAAPAPGSSPTEGATEGPSVSSRDGSSAEAILDSNRMEVTHEVNALLRKMKTLQGRCGSRVRFHFVVERDVDAVVERWIQQSSSEVNDCSRIETRILYSPTLSFEDDRCKKSSIKFVRALNAASFQSMRVKARARTPQRGGAAPASNGNGNGGNPSGSSSDVAGSEVGIPPFPGWDKMEIPSWFPFKDDQYTEGPQVSEREYMTVSAPTAKRFMKMSDGSLTRLYNRFFHTLHREIKMTAIYTKLKFKYSSYTPPWIRVKCKVGGKVYRIGTDGVCKLKVQRSLWGTQRIAILLAAFYEKEPLFAIDLLNHLIAKEEVSGSDTGEDVTPSRITPVRRGIEDAGSQVAAPSGTRRRTESSTARPPRPVGRPANYKLSEDADVSNAAVQRRLEFVPEPVGEHSPSSGQQVTPQSEHPNVPQSTPSNAMVPERSHETQVQGTVPNTQPRTIVRCAAGSKCVFRDNPDMQEDTEITLKYKKCKKAIHDLCGGGEGSKTCPSC